jgi:ADP-heptose:LPS heptosyltransferase
MGRIRACDAFLGPSTGPTQLAAALGVPLVALMGLSPNRGPSRWAPLGDRVQVLQYPGPEADLAGGMDRLDPGALLPHLARCLAQPQARP